MRSLTMFFLSFVVLLLSSPSVLAYNPAGEALPVGAVNSATYYRASTGMWMPTMRAMTWNSGSVSSDGVTTERKGQFGIINHVSIAQWVDWSISATRKDWRVLRPGTYASGSVTFQIASNNDVVVTFHADDPQYLAEQSVTRTIPKWFAYSVQADINEADANGWFRGADYSEQNPLSILVKDNAALHAGANFHIWEKLDVVPSNSSSEYEGSGTVTIRLTNMKHWVEPDNGTFYPVGKSPMDLQI